VRIVPVTVRFALPFVERVHRRLPKVQGAMWAIGCIVQDEVIGVAVVGHPAQAWTEHDRVPLLNVMRVAVIEGFYNACSMLYGGCSRAGKAMGARDMVTYTHADEHGTSLKAAGWIEGGMTSGGEYDRDSRQRALAIDPLPKRRWWAPWSERAKSDGRKREAA
jgi:hypothetical protein